MQTPTYFANKLVQLCVIQFSFWIMVQKWMRLAWALSHKCDDKCQSVCHLFVFACYITVLLLLSYLVWWKSVWFAQTERGRSSGFGWHWTQFCGLDWSWSGRLLRNCGAHAQFVEFEFAKKSCVTGQIHLQTHSLAPECGLVCAVGIAIAQAQVEYLSQPVRV